MDIFEFEKLLAEKGGHQRHEWLKWYYRKTGRDYRQLRRHILEFLPPDVVKEIGFGTAYTGYWFELRREWIEDEVGIANDNSIGCKTGWRPLPATTLLEFMIQRLRSQFFVRHLPFRRYAKIHCFIHTEALITLFR